MDDSLPNTDQQPPRKRAPSRKKVVKKATATKKKGVKAATPRKSTSRSSVKSTPSQQKANQRKKPSPAAKTAKMAKAAEEEARKPAAEASKDTSLFENYDDLATLMGSMAEKSQALIANSVAKSASLDTTQLKQPLDPLRLGDTVSAVLKSLNHDPVRLMHRQFELYERYASLMSNTTRRLAGEDDRKPSDGVRRDKRFAHSAWTENPLLEFLKESYFATSDWLTSVVDELDDIDPHEKAKASFYTRQLIDALSPSNFPAFNPDVVDDTIESGGENLVRGLKNLIEDMERGNGELAIRQADLDYFELGKNIATTPGKVVYQNELIQLIQYEPATERVAKTPMLIVPPWINKFYILDLQPQNSFIRWLVEQGRTVFVISWVNPDETLSNLEFRDYIHKGVFEALDAIKEATGEEKADTIGYCVGGTMLATALALMAKRQDNRINSATFFTAQAEFSDPGELMLFIDEAQIKAIEQQIDAAGGVLSGRAMSTTFNMLRPQDLIWSYVVNNYYRGKEPPKFDLLYWNADSTRMAKAVHLYYLREFYLHNKLAKDELIIDDTILKLSEINIPLFMQAGESDHIAPHPSVYRTAKLFDAEKNDDVTFMLAGSGHIAGVINHPDKNKYHHSINTALPDSLDDWKAGATKHPGSWWPYWMEWLNERSGGMVPKRIPGDGDLDVIEDAPGSYVKVQA